MPCPPTCFSLVFLFENVSKTKVTFVTFCVKSFSYYNVGHSQFDVERVWHGITDYYFLMHFSFDKMLFSISIGFQRLRNIFTVISRLSSNPS